MDFWKEVNVVNINTKCWDYFYIKYILVSWILQGACNISFKKLKRLLPFKACFPCWKPSLRRPCVLQANYDASRRSRCKAWGHRSRVLCTELSGHLCKGIWERPHWHGPTISFLGTVLLLSGFQSYRCVNPLGLSSILIKDVANSSLNIFYMHITSGVLQAA